MRIVTDFRYSSPRFFEAMVKWAHEALRELTPGRSPAPGTLC